MDITWNSDRNVYYEYVSQLSAPGGASGCQVASSENTTTLKGYAGKPIVVNRYGRSNNVLKSDLRNDRGKKYTGLYYATYKVSKNIDKCHFGFVFNQLETWGQPGEPSFSLNSDKDKLTVLASWDKSFKNKAINATLSEATGSQYFAKFAVGSSLRTVENTNTIFSFKE